jgi:hypothetical protein
MTFHAKIAANVVESLGHLCGTHRNERGGHSASDKVAFETGGGAIGVRPRVPHAIENENGTGALPTPVPQSR